MDLDLIGMAEIDISRRKHKGNFENWNLLFQIIVTYYENIPLFQLE